MRYLFDFDEKGKKLLVWELNIERSPYFTRVDNQIYTQKNEPIVSEVKFELDYESYQIINEEYLWIQQETKCQLYNMATMELSFESSKKFSFVGIAKDDYNKDCFFITTLDEEDKEMLYLKGNTRKMCKKASRNDSHFIALHEGKYIVEMDADQRIIQIALTSVKCFQRHQSLKWIRPSNTKNQLLVQKEVLYMIDSEGKKLYFYNEKKERWIKYPTFKENAEKISMGYYEDFCLFRRPDGRIAAITNWSEVSIVVDDETEAITIDTNTVFKTDKNGAIISIWNHDMDLILEARTSKGETLKDSRIGRCKVFFKYNKDGKEIAFATLSGKRNLNPNNEYAKGESWWLLEEYNKSGQCIGIYYQYERKIHKIGVKKNTENHLVIKNNQIWEMTKGKQCNRIYGEDGKVLAKCEDGNIVCKTVGNKEFYVAQPSNSVWDSDGNLINKSN